MSVKIGGFAAFAIALVIAGGIERVVHTVVNRSKPTPPQTPPHLPKQDAFWAEFSTQLEALRKEDPSIKPADLRTKLKEKLVLQFDAALAECPTAYDVQCFIEQFDAKLSGFDNIWPAE